MSGESPTRSPAAPAHPAAATPPPALSVVIPTHDTRELTLSCLASLAAARPPPSEVVVVDDGSSDGTAAAVAASYPAVRLLQHRGPRGFTAAVNTGAATAAGDLLLLLNSDTEVAPDALGALLDAFAGAPRLGVAGAALAYPDGRPQWSGGRAPRSLWLLALGSGLPHRLGALQAWRRLRPVSGHGQGEVEWVTGAALAVRREVWDAAGGLDPRFALYAQDLDLCVRARALGWRVAVVPASRVTHHHGATIGKRSLAAPSAAGEPFETRAHLDAPLLWADLVRWASKQGGGAAGRRAARWLRLGGLLQRCLLAVEGLRGAEARRRAREQRRILCEAAAAARRAAAAGAAVSLPPPGRT